MACSGVEYVGILFWLKILFASCTASKPINEVRMVLILIRLVLNKVSYGFSNFNPALNLPDESR